MAPSPPQSRPAVAFGFRYGPGEHAQLFHALPQVIEALSRHVEVHYYGPRSRTGIPDAICRHATLHQLPWHVDRTRRGDKWIKTALWLLALPWVARHARRQGARVFYLDETIPFTASIARRCFGPHTVLTVADLFVDIYLTRSRPARGLARWIRRVDERAWQRLPLIFTRARATRTYLEGLGIDPARVHPVYDPCDFTVFHPGDRAAARKIHGYSADEIVLVHHGILHPNKGNDRILRAVAALAPQHPRLRFLLVGDGPDMPRLKRLVAELDLAGRCQLTGWLPTREALNTALNSADIGLVMRIGAPSDDFHMTGALVHSMACGLPILAARLGGVCEVVREDENGLLFHPGDPEELQQKLALLVTDPARRARLGSAALADARRLFAIDRTVRETVEPLLNLVNAP